VSRVLRFVLRLYPAPWRVRYGPELDALIEDSGASWRMVGDLAREALKMRLLETYGTVSASRFTAAAGAVGAAVGAVVFLATPSRIASATTIVIESDGTSAIMPLPVVEAAFSDDNLRALVERYGLYQHQQGDAPAASIRRFRRDVGVTLAELQSVARKESAPLDNQTPAFHNRGTLRLSFEYPDEPAARAVTVELARLILDSRLREAESAAGGAQARSGERYRVTGPPQRVVVGPGAGIVAAWGLAVGVLAGLALVALRRMSSSKA
jgi:hypothetical protein